MRKIAIFLAALLCAALAVAQYAPPSSNPTQLQYSGTSFWTQGKTGYISASGTTANIALSYAGANQLQVFNDTTGVAFVALCPTSTCTASAGSAGTSTSDYPVAPGSVVVLSVPQGTSYVAVILSTSTGPVYVTPGAGI